MAGMAIPGARTALRRSALLWTLCAVAGQWLFFAYIARAYGPSTLTGNWPAWLKNPNHILGYVPGDTAGNAAFGAHALLAGVIAFGGALQLLPWIRRRVPVLHRWSGRVFMVTALGVSITGLYMVWVRGATANLTGSIAISGDAALIILFALLAWQAARRRDFASHRVQALRLFMVANGQWFFRVAVFGWLLVNGGPAGFGKHFDGPIPVFWGFGCYLVPLALLELYLRAERGGVRMQWAAALALLVSAAYIVIGSFAAYLIIWRPMLTGA